MPSKPSVKPSAPAPRFRVEKDSMGDVNVPAERLWGAQTQRALENFRVSGRTMPERFLVALAQIKWASFRSTCSRRARARRRT